MFCQEALISVQHSVDVLDESMRVLDFFMHTCAPLCCGAFFFVMTFCQEALIYVQHCVTVPDKSMRLLGVAYLCTSAVCLSLMEGVICARMRQCAAACAGQQSWGNDSIGKDCEIGQDMASPLDVRLVRRYPNDPLSNPPFKRELDEWRSYVGRFGITGRMQVPCPDMCTLVSGALP